MSGTETICYAQDGFAAGGISLSPNKTPGGGSLGKGGSYTVRTSSNMNGTLGGGGLTIYGASYGFGAGGDGIVIIEW